MSRFAAVASAMALVVSGIAIGALLTFLVVVRPRLEKSLAGIRERIGAVLTAEQRATFDQLIREDRRRADRFFLEGPPPPPPGFGPPR